MSMEESYLGDIDRQFGGDKKKVQEAVRMIKGDADGPQQPQRDEDRVVDMLVENFYERVTRAEVREALRRNGGDADKAQIELIDTVEAKNKVEALSRMFASMFSQEVLVSTLESLGGDVEEAARVLSLSPKANRTALRPPAPELVEKERQIVGGLQLHRVAREYPLLELDEMRRVLEKHSNDLVLCMPELQAMSEAATLKRLEMLYPEIPAPTREAVAQNATWSLAECQRELSRLRDAGSNQMPVPLPDAKAVALAKEERADRLIQLTQMDTELLHRSTMSRVGEILEEVRPNDFSVPPAPVQEKPVEDPLSSSTAESLQQKNKEEEEGAVVAKKEKGEAKQHDHPAFTGDLLASSGNLNVVRVQPSSLRVDIGQAVMVQYEAVGDYAMTAYDWIAMYEEGKTGGSYVKYKYVAGADARKGELRFTPFAHGRYVFRFMTNKTYTVCGESAVVTVGPIFELRGTVLGNSREVLAEFEQRTGQPHSNAWVGLYASSGPVPAAPDAYAAYEYLPAGKLCGSAKLHIPKAGRWELRLYPSKSYAFCSAVTTFEYSGETALELRCDGPTCTVHVQCPALDLAVDQVWVGLFSVSDPAKKDRPSRWMYLRPGATAVSFSTPRTPGEYEARLFAHASLSPVAKSPTSILVK